MLILTTFGSFSNGYFSAMGDSLPDRVSVSLTVPLIACALGLVRRLKQRFFGAVQFVNYEYSRCSRTKSLLFS